jgi:hypothetical protein
MGWLVALIAVIVFVWLLVAFPRFRIAVVFIVVALVAMVIFWIKAENDRDAKSHSLISQSQLELHDVALRKSYGSWEVVGTVKNNSAHTLTGFTLQITVRDCPENSDCIVIGEDNVKIWLLTVPPSQLRTFEGFALLSNMPTPKKLVWNYKLVETTARIE